jgi:hypothetical protein
MTRKGKKFVPVQFIGEEIETTFEKAPLYSKKPGPPNSFTWQGEKFDVKDTLSTWFDFGRKGKAAKNMREENLREAKRRGSWGVGRYYFRVDITSGWNQKEAEFSTFTMIALRRTPGTGLGTGFFGERWKNRSNKAGLVKY